MSVEPPPLYHYSQQVKDTQTLIVPYIKPHFLNSIYGPIFLSNPLNVQFLKKVFFISTGDVCLSCLFFFFFFFFFFYLVGSVTFN